MNFRVALLQIAPCGNDQTRNLEKGLKFCREARALGADLALFPELWNVGCTQCPIGITERQSWMASAIDRQSDFFQSFAGLAQELSMNIAITYLETHLPKPRNSISIINREGQVVLTYSKVFICNFGETELLTPGSDIDSIGCDVNCSPGDSFNICTLSGDQGEVKVGAMVCADREFPEPATCLMLNGAELIVVPNACDWDEIRTAGLKTRALENLLGIAMANYPMPRNNGGSRAYSCVAWKNGKAKEMLIAKANELEQVVVADFDMDEIRSFRKIESWRMDYRLQRQQPPNAV